MTVFYTASYYGKKTYQKHYDLVRTMIKRFKVELISPEEGNYQSVLDSGTAATMTDPFMRHYESIRQGIHTADCTIIEGSYQDFQLGHEATLAIMEKKPVLVLSTHEDFSKKINHDYFFGARHTPQTIEGTIQNFFVKVREFSQSRRFNMFLYTSQVEHLESMGKKYDMNMSEYIRRLINLDRRSARMSAA